MADTASAERRSGNESAGAAIAKPRGDYAARVSLVRDGPEQEKQAAKKFHIKFGVWLSLVECLVRDQEAGGSNPLTPTIKEC